MGLSKTKIYVVNGDKKESYKDVHTFMEYYEGRVKDVTNFMINNLSKFLKPIF
jgi:hypothetical protein